MPKIFKTNTQETALKEINANLRLMPSIIDMIRNESDTGSMSFVFGKERIHVEIDRARKNDILKSYWKRMHDKTLKLSKENAISLDDKDMEILNQNPETDTAALIRALHNASSYDSYDANDAEPGMPLYETDNEGLSYEKDRW